MDVKSAFLYGRIEEEVYVCQPHGSEDPDHLDKVYKVVKALYSLHQAPRAWYETLANYLLGNGFHRGKIDQTLFIKRITYFLLRIANVKTASTPVDMEKTLVKDAGDSVFELVVYTDSDYVGASLDRKSTTGGYQFLGSRLISWHCKKQTVFATSTTKAKYVVAASCCGQVKQSSMVGFGEMI
nr:ribonuclease H-like domain, reverse transcriptase, RNA-dependent DNA polymerase [Tanacetum cinerariifolium]